MSENEGFGTLVDEIGEDAGSGSGGGPPGSQTLDSMGIEVLMRYYEQFPSASLPLYQSELARHGYSASEATIWRVLKSHGVTRGMPNLIPMDKWSDTNFIDLWITSTLY